MWMLAQQTFVKEWTNQTTIHPVGLAMVAVLGAAMLVVPRKYAVWPMIVMACFVAPAQRVVIATLDFNLLRIMVIFGWVRLIMRREASGLRWGLMDSLIIAFCVFRGLASIILRGTPEAIVYQLGMAFDSIGMYFLFRMLVRSWDDVYSVARGFFWVSLPVAAAFVFESQTRRNVFSIFGGVPEITKVRDGRLRCQGAFAHQILAGCFWATLLPLILSEFWSNWAGRVRAVIGVVACLIVVVACASSTPLIAVGAAFVGYACWPLRNRMRVVRWGIGLSLVGLHLAMEAPVWHLISRAAVVGGSTAYHRYALIDAAIRNFHEWGLIGSTRGTAHWGYHLFDVTNYYIVMGLNGGVILLALFIGIIAVGFRDAGRIVDAASHAGDARAMRLGWALGVSLFVHAACFLGVSYFGQIIMIWYLLLAMLGAVEASQPVTSPSTSRRRNARRRPVVDEGPPAGTPAVAPAGARIVGR